MCTYCECELVYRSEDYRQIHKMYIQPCHTKHMHSVGPNVILIEFVPVDQSPVKIFVNEMQRSFCMLFSAKAEI